MKKSTFISISKLKTKFGFLFLWSTFALCSHLGFSQTPELFEERILLNNIATPWGFTFINSNEVLFTEKQGKVYRYVISTNTNTEITGVPAISQNGQGGLLDIALHPDFSTNSFVYLTYAVADTGGQTTALGRGKLVGTQLQNFTELFRALPIVNSGQHFGSRIVFDKNKFLYMSVGDRGTPANAQDKNNHSGKVLRFNDDGTVPTSNPLVGVANTKPEIFCWGNRNIQGMAMNPATGEIYAHEHGPKGGDELNLIKPNTNYGWPAVTFGIDYNGTIISSDTTLPGMELPLTYWVPSIAPSGMTFLTNAQPDNEADILIGALAGTHIHWLKMKDDKRISSTRSMNGYARFRDVRQAPDGKIYAMTESPNRFVLLRSTIPTVTLDSSATVCKGLSSTSIVYTTTTNTPTKYSIVWNTQAVSAGFTNITAGSLPASQIPISIPSGAAAGIYSGTLSVNNGTASIGYDINITVNGNPTIVLGVNPNVNAGDTNALLAYTNTSNSPTRYSINWLNTATTAGFLNATNVPLPNSAITIAVPTSAAKGSYFGILTVSNSNCTSLGDTISVTVDKISSIEEKQAFKNGTVYPNPFSEKIIFKNSTGAENYTLTNLFGQAIWSGKKIEQQDFSNLKSGLYFLTIIKDNERQTLNLVKE